MDTNTESKPFHVATIVAVIYGIPVIPNSDGIPMQPLYDLMSYLTGDTLMTHQLSRAAEVCVPHLRNTLPALCGPAMDAQVAQFQRDYAYVTQPDVFGAAFVKGWIEETAAKFGERHTVTPLPNGVWQSKDPLEEATVRRIPTLAVAVPEGTKTT